MLPLLSDRSPEDSFGGGLPVGQVAPEKARDEFSACLIILIEILVPWYWLAVRSPELALRFASAGVLMPFASTFPLLVLLVPIHWLAVGPPESGE